MKELDFFIQIIDNVGSAASAIAVESSTTDTSYESLFEKVGRYSQYLDEKIGKNESEELSLVGIKGSQDELSYALIFAAWLNGYSYFAFNELWPNERNKSIEEELPFAIILDENDRKEILSKSHNLQVTNDWEGFCEGLKKEFKAHATRYAYVISTSGSTGKAKYIPISFENLNAFMAHYSSENGYDISPEDRILQSYNLSFDVSVFSYLVAFSFGATLVLPAKKNMLFLSVLDALVKKNITIISCVPSFLSAIKSRLKELSFPSLRYSFFSGESLYGAEARLWMSACPNAKVFNCYGPTETTIVFTSEELNILDDVYFETGEALPLGEPFGGIKSQILEGELCVSGPQVFDGYFDKGTISPRAVYFPTGDLVEVDEMGKMIFKGRVDFQVQIKGYRVEPSAVDAYLRRLLGQKTYTLGWEDDEKNMRLVCFIEASDSVPKQMRDKMMDALKVDFPLYHIPEFYYEIDQLPLNPNGKVDHKKLLEIVGVKRKQI